MHIRGFGLSASRRSRPQRSWRPEIGRFISQDPIGDGVNWYAYVGNNPVVWVDPEGLDYLDLSLTFGWSPKAVGLAGVMIGPNPCAKKPWWKKWLHPYTGLGVGSPGFGGGVMWGTSDPGPEVNFAVAGGWIAGASKGASGVEPEDECWEYGISWAPGWTPGIWVGGYEVFW